MSSARRSRWLPALFATLAAADAGARVLAPRTRTSRPARIEPRSYFTSEEIERGKRFARGQRAIFLASSGLELAVLAALVKAPPRRPRARLGDGAGAGAAAGAALSLASTLGGLPLSALARRRAKAVGLVTQSWSGWLADVAKQAAIGAPLAGAGGATVVALTRRYPRAWWAPAAAGALGVSVLFATLGPVLLDPIFSRFNPLPEGETRADVLALAAAAGVEVGEVYEVDASRRTTAANAYVTGLGPTKRVVLFDTLLDRYSRDEIRLVVAHELAHVRHRDVPRSLAYAAVVLPAAALTVQRLAAALAPERAGTAGALPALALAAAIVGAPVTVFGARLSRAVERRADALSLELTGAPEAFISFQRRIALQNVADLEPPRFVRALLATHPPTLERIGAAAAFAPGADA